MRKVLWISPSGTDWKVHWQGEQTGPVFALKQDAIRKARQMVRELPAGEVASIRIQGQNGQIQEEWTYGNDPYPPQG